MKFIEGILLYVCIQEPARPYIGPEDPPNKPKEWKVSVAVTNEDQADAIEEFATGLQAKLSVKKFKADKFKETFKTDLPDGVSKAWVYTLRRSTELGKTGKPVPPQYAPKVFVMQGNTRLDITNEKLVGNGSTGKVSLEVFQRDNGKNSIYLKNVMVDTLKEYVKTSSNYEAGSEFDSEAEEAPAAPVKPAVPKGAAKPVKSAVKADDEDSDIPF